MKSHSQSNRILTGILIGIFLGYLTGFLFGEKMLAVAFLGEIFLRALKAIIVPLILFSMVTGIGNLGDVRKIGKLGKRTILYYLITTAISVTIGIFLVNLLKPGVGIPHPTIPLPEKISSKESFSFINVLIGIIPENIFQAMVEVKILPLITFSLLLGGILTTLGDKGKRVLELFDTLNDAIMQMVHLIMLFAPIGVFGLVAGKLAQVGGGSAFYAELTRLGRYALTVILGLSLHGFLVLPLLLKFWGKVSPYVYIKNILEALTTAFSTASSSATLPITIESVEQKNSVPNRVASFVLPLGATVNMDGTALYEAVAAIFIAQMYGIHLTAQHELIIFLTATLAAIGAAGIPEAGLVTMVIVLKSVGLPLEGIAAILTIDWFLDRCRTTVNVLGDAVGCAVVNAQERETGTYSNGEVEERSEAN